MPQTLKVLARGTAMVHVFHREGVREFVGRTHDASLGLAGGWPAKPPTDPSEIPAEPEYILAIRHGDLWAADQATAKVANVKFDPKFGGEFDEEPKTAAEPEPATGNDSSDDKTP